MDKMAKICKFLNSSNHSKTEKGTINKDMVREALREVVISNMAKEEVMVSNSKEVDIVNSNKEVVMANSNKEVGMDNSSKEVDMDNLNREAGIVMWVISRAINRISKNPIVNSQVHQRTIQAKLVINKQGKQKKTVSSSNREMINLSKSRIISCNSRKVGVSRVVLIVREEEVVVDGETMEVGMDMVMEEEVVTEVEEVDIV